MMNNAGYYIILLLREKKQKNMKVPGINKDDVNLGISLRQSPNLHA
jgi:hypothetical protein